MIVTSVKPINNAFTSDNYVMFTPLPLSHVVSELELGVGGLEGLDNKKRGE